MVCYIVFFFCSNFPLFLLLSIGAYFATLSKISRFAKCYILKHFNFVFLRTTIYISLAMLSKMSFNQMKQLYQRNNNVKIKKNTMAELYVNCNNKASVIILSPLTTTSMYSENSFLQTEHRKNEQ